MDKVMFYTAKFMDLVGEMFKFVIVLVPALWDAICETGLICYHELLNTWGVKKNLLYIGKNVNDFEYVGEISSQEVVDIIKKDTNSQSIRIRDYKYKLYKKSDVTWFLSKDNTNEYKYISEFFDCDNFTDVLRGRLEVAFPGIALCENIVVWSENDKILCHAICGFIDENKHHNYIEPQSDTVFNKPANWTHLEANF